jgi:ribbon-helix-helix CopG family protein
MLRTNIYLGDDQSAALDKMARAQGTSRADLIRRFIDAGLGGSIGPDLEADLAAIRDSFGVLRDEDVQVTRQSDERARHLARVIGRDPRR